MPRSVKISSKDTIERSENLCRRQNEHIKENYDKISVTLPKSTKKYQKVTDDNDNGLSVCLHLMSLFDGGKQNPGFPSKDHEEIENYITYLTGKPEDVLHPFRACSGGGAI